MRCVGMEGYARCVAVGAAFLVLGAFAVACVPSDAAPPDRGVNVAGPPPPDPPEQMAGARPPGGGSEVWVKGYWLWIGNRWAWVPGHWEEPPRGARAWRAPRYSVHDGTYSYEAGGWVGR